MRRHKKNGVFGQVMPYAHQAQKKALKAQKKAQKKAGPVVEQAWDRVAPAVETAVETAKDKLSPAAIEARDRAEAAVVAAMLASEPYRKEAMKRGTAAWLALRGDLRPPAPKKRHWIRNLLLLGGIGGSAFVAYRILRHGTASEWMPKQSSATETDDEGTKTDTTPPSSAATTTPTTSAESNAADMSGKHKNDGPNKQPAGTGSRANRKPGDLPKS